MPDSAEQPRAGLSRAALQLTASIVALVRSRLELVTIEFEEQRERTKDILVLAVVAAVFLSFAVMILSALILALFWETHPVIATVCVAGGYAAIGIAAIAMLKNRQRQRPFAATLAELERDVEALRGKR
jgi:uncharacterized membrane protein YqjE